MEESRVTLHGFWASPYVCKVIWALKLKGVPFEYVEENLSDKSAALLEYNPVHKKVPVLVHGGKAVAESAVILEYIEETWPDRDNPLLPADPYDRALARFWIDFGQQKRLTFMAFFLSAEEDKERTGKQVLDTLRIIQDEALADKKFFSGNKIGLVDLSYGWLVHWIECVQDIVGLPIMEPHSLQKLCEWATNFRQEPVIKENLPDKMEVAAHIRRFRERFASKTRTST
ncbi:Glutathione S-transferase tau 7 [Dorcoceras hygrometricum]|uniref:Glutathione S-transferase n=1 Tax=Dorcoceras hygrometricum TaxID=472368 RepID=A0A2Z7CWW8_9LAMI|nr:Glutathione S-transferase tau 7 [Dorcoceras hygrometricum]